MDAGLREEQPRRLVDRGSSDRTDKIHCDAYRSLFIRLSGQIEVRVSTGRLDCLADPMKERLLNAIWSLAVRSRDLGAKIGLWGRLEPLMIRVGVRLIPAPSAEVDVVLPSGLRLLMPPGFPTARSIAAGVYEKSLTAVLFERLREGMGVAVVGANVGYHCLLAAAIVGDSGRVFAFEPDPRNFDYLLENVRRNRLKNVIAVEKAIADKTGRSSFARDPIGVAGRLTASPGKRDSVEVGTITLDEYFDAQGWPAIDFVILDIEGGEAAAIVGMEDLAGRNPTLQMVMELHPSILVKQGSDIDAIARDLGHLGFTVGFTIGGRPKRFSIPDGFPRSQTNSDLLLLRG